MNTQRDHVDQFKTSEHVNQEENHKQNWGGGRGRILDEQVEERIIIVTENDLKRVHGKNVGRSG